MERNPLISVIIPVYNVEDCLARCMDSLCGQTYAHLEFICVDDGSTDGSLAILRDYEAKDSRVKVFTKPNGGVASARNIALDVAQGEWITGMDPDDYMATDAYERIIRTASDDVDMISFGTQVVVDEGHEELSNRIEGMQRGYDIDLKKKGRHNLTGDEAHNITVVVWNKLFRHSLLKESGLRFDENLWNDSDYCFYHQWCAHVKSVYFVNERLHRRVLRSSSISFSSDKQTYVWRCKSHLLSMQRLISYYREIGKEVEKRSFLRSRIMNKVERVFEYRALTPDRNAWGAEFLEAISRCGIENDSAYFSVIHNTMDRFRAGRQAEHFYRSCQKKADSCPLDEARQGDIHVAMIVNDASFSPAVVTLQSIKDELAGTHPVCVHVLSVCLSSFSRGILEAMEADNFHLRVWELGLELHHSHLPKDSLTKSVEDYLKPVLPVVLSGVKRCIYLEPGLLAGPGLSELPALDMGDRFIAAVSIARGAQIDKQGWNMRSRESWRRQNMEHFYAPHLMLMDLEAMRDCEAGVTWLDASLMQRDVRPFPMQHALNLSLQNSMMPLEDKLEVYCVNLRAALTSSAHLPHPKMVHRGAWLRCYERSPLSLFPVQQTYSPAPASAPAASTQAKAPASSAPSLEEMQQQLKELSYRYYRVKFLSRVTWGKRRARYVMKTHEYKDMRRELRSAMRVQHELQKRKGGR